MVTNQQSTITFPASASWLFEFGEFVKLNGLFTPVLILYVSGDRVDVRTGLSEFSLPHFDRRPSGKQSKLCP